jgi:HAE1 family hydrophobic/amphiphilic exporter-1
VEGFYSAGWKACATFYWPIAAANAFNASANFCGSKSGIDCVSLNKRFKFVSVALPGSMRLQESVSLSSARTSRSARRAVRVSRANVDRSEASLRRVVSETIAAVEQAYWNVVAARRDVSIRESTLALADRQREDAKVRVEAQVAPESDLAQFTAEIERRRGDLFASREVATRAELLLKALILDSADAPQWNTTLMLEDLPAPSTAPVDLATALKDAAERPELADVDARQALQAIELDAARDRLKPQLDIVGGYTARGVAGAKSEDALPFPGLPSEFPEELQGALGASLESVALQRFPDLAAGIVLTIPLGQRAAHADIATAESAARQIAAARERIRIQIAVEVRNAAAALDTAGQRIEAARAARTAAEIQLRAEEDRLSAGATTPFFVLTRQNELAAAEVADAAATAAYRRALTELARARGTLLRDRAVDWRTTP